MAEPYQSLYRRYRPQRFSEVRGQDHVTRAVRNAVRDATVSHAYLFSGPRGTGKTSTARILAKALNCAAPVEGEPCGECESCVAVAAGSSLDVHELDAASNNGVEAMRDLVARAALGTPGRWKVYIVDEVHMLSAAASNALLKTLEEPPGHVVFVLATTDPQKVLPTIRSRTQHFEFRLLGGDTLVSLLKDVSSDASLGLPDAAIDHAVRRGQGSARDALSVLDQIAAAGEVTDEEEALDRLVEALVERDAGGVLTSVGEAMAAGRDPQRLAVDLLGHLRNAFLATMAPELVPLPDDARDVLAEQAHRLGPATIVRVIEVLGSVLVDMRDSLDPRVSLEVALVRAARPDVDATPASLLERIERLERGMPASGRPAPPPALSADAAAGEPVSEPPAENDAATAAPGRGASPAAEARATLGALRRGREAGNASSPARPRPAPAARPAAADARADAPADPVDPAQPSPAPGSGPPTGGSLPTRDQLTLAWGDSILAGLKGRARALYRAGRWVEVREGKAVFELPNETHRRFCEEARLDVERALAAHFGLPVPVQLVAAPEEGADGEGAEDEEDIEVSSLEEAPDAPGSPADLLRQAFPGAQEVQS